MNYPGLKQRCFGGLISGNFAIWGLPLLFKPDDNRRAERTSEENACMDSLRDRYRLYSSKYKVSSKKNLRGSQIPVYCFFNSRFRISLHSKAERQYG